MTVARGRLPIQKLRRLLRPPATAIVIAVPEAEHLVGDVSGPGMPPHVTLLWPFFGRPGRRRLRRLAAVAARHAQFDFTLARVGTFPGVVYFAPVPAAPFVDLVRALTETWPGKQPYGGAFPDVIPHVTVRPGPAPDADERARLEAALPIACAARELVLLSPVGDGWREDYRAPLGPPRDPPTSA
jgi:hypothetical protein